MINSKTFLALDLEMNTPEGSSTSGKIIQVGIAIGNLHTYKHNLEPMYIEKFWYVNPYEKIYPRITELTGISNDDVNEKSTPLDDIQNQISYLMNLHQCFPNPVVWGGGDVDLLKSELRSSVGNCRIFGHREIDVKTIYTFFKLSRNEKTNSSLKSALNSTKNNFVGTPHRALDDARNTLNLFFALMSKQMMINNFINEAQKLK